VVQTPGAPLLSITPSGASAILSWPVSSINFSLENSASLASGSWTAAPMTLVTNGATISATVPASSGHTFYRLHGGD
jgi:hypothetical protein